MSLLPEVERELLRVARLPLPHATSDTFPAGAPAQQHAGRLPRWSLSTIVPVTVALAALAIGGVFVSSLHTGRAIQSGRRAQGSTVASGFSGAPRTQANHGWVETRVCPLAARNRYLPPRVGCVTVLRADVDGDGRPDLILLYSRLSHERASQLGLPASMSSDYVATQAILKVVRASGGTTATRVYGGCGGCAPTAEIVAVAHVNADPGQELFVHVSHTSSGETAAAYGFHNGRLVPAGVILGYGGDSPAQTGFDCLAGNPPRLVERTFIGGGNIYGSWTETVITYAWHGPHLVRTSQRTFRRRGFPPHDQTDVGAGCIHREQPVNH
jgi:hypothetical protein